MIENPTVSIGMPVYNGEKYLEEALISILNQTYKNIEVIVCDNASADNTGKICKKYITLDRRVKYFRNEKNYGAAYNYNRAFKLSSGKYFKWASHDDLIHERFVEKCVKILESDEDISLCYPKTIIFGEKNYINLFNDDLHLMFNSVQKRLILFFKRINLCNSIFGLFRKELLGKTSLIGAYPSSDVVLIMQACILGKIYEIPERLFYRREHNANIRKLSKKEQAKWFDSSYSSFSHNFFYWNLYKNFLKSLYFSDLDKKQKFDCYHATLFWQYRIVKNNIGRYKQNIKRVVCMKKENAVLNQINLKKRNLNDSKRSC